MKKATIKTMAIPHRSFRLSRPDRAIVEKRFTLPVSRPVTLVKSESCRRDPTGSHRGETLDYPTTLALKGRDSRADSMGTELTV
ncbi:hypothetical protein I79_025078 [Cricetulus griseus]|uniref:Uncharacterized protein n=1 Tax=Cricetulus griseus TaxID=10029 RepID=G3IMD9_CRIGR|nr:hypothetical protein I79_025078 [Cricetulus griseus]